MLSSAYQVKKCLESLIRREGQNITLRKVTIGEYNPATGQSAETISDTTVKALVKDSMSDMSKDAIDRVDKIEGTTAPFNLSAVLQHSEDPTKAWRVVYDSKEYQIIHVQPRSMAGVVLSYELVLKR
jgi:hypothetical protein